MAPIWDDIFDNYGVKTVTPTDKGKSAYVLSASQCEALAAAHITPSDERPAPPFEVKVLFDPSVPAVQASYYFSKRSEKAGRDPEPRLGREIIRSWMHIGDAIVIGNIGPDVFVAKAAAITSDARSVGADLPKLLDRKTILRRAGRAKGKPKKILRQTVTFVRNAYVIAGALVRANGACEMPKCKTSLFSKDDGTPFLEVHHVIPLSEGGDDALANAAALCPMCHRELHFGALRRKKRQQLAACIKKVA